MARGTVHLLIASPGIPWQLHLISEDYIQLLHGLQDRCDEVGILEADAFLQIQTEGLLAGREDLLP